MTMILTTRGKSSPSSKMSEPRPEVEVFDVYDLSPRRWEALSLLGFQEREHADRICQGFQKFHKAERGAPAPRGGL